MELKLPARPPFSFSSVVRSHGWMQLAPFLLDEAGGVLRYAHQLTSGRVVDLLMQAEPGDAGVRVTVDADLDEVETAEVAGKVTWMLGLDMDFATFYARARQAPKLAQAEAEARGRVLRSATLFEDTVKTILTTNTSWAGTIRMVGTLVEQFGAAPPDELERQAFPTPEVLARSDAGTLRNDTRLGYRAPYVLELAQAVAAGELDLEAYKTSGLPTPELRQELLAIKGVGAYAAANLLMLLGRYDYLPVDSWALKVVSHEWHSGEPIGPAEVEAAFEDWGQWKGLAFWFWDWDYKWDSKNEEKA